MGSLNSTGGKVLAFIIFNGALLGASHFKTEIAQGIEGIKPPTRRHTVKIYSSTSAYFSKPPTRRHTL